MARHELATILRYWRYRPEMWQAAGFTAPADVRPYAGLSIAHPIIEVTQARMVVRRQQMGFSENDIIARHAFMAYLTECGLPVPSLVVRGPSTGAGAEGSTWAAVPIVPLTDPQHAAGIQFVIEHALYEIQVYVPDRHFVSDSPDEEDDLVAAARMRATHRVGRVLPAMGRGASCHPARCLAKRRRVGALVSEVM